MSRRRALAVVTTFAIALGTTTLTAGPAPAEDDPPGPPDLVVLEGTERPGEASGPTSYLLVLETRATGRVYTNRLKQGRASAAAAARDQLDVVEEAQDAVVDELPPGTPVIYTTHAALAAVAVRADSDQAGELAAIPGVASVHPITPLELDNSYAVKHQHAPEAWQAHSNRGEDVRVAVIDTGIDYTHADFGGAGTEAAYDAAHAVADDGSPWAGTAKVVGGYDFAGDEYDARDANPVADPDPNPLDCQGHGSHVAGTVAGYGVNDDGSTYTGAYNESTDLAAMRIGPGMAPEADLLALRVFGCEGSTDLVPQAIDWALDPDGNGATADAVDVINMSLGSPYGTAEDGSAVAANAAAEQGVSVVTSTGNEGDLYDVGGSPGAAPRVLAVAASADAQSVIAETLSLTFSGSGARQYGALRSLNYNWSGTDLTGQVAVPTGTPTGCANDLGGISGKVALLTWSAAACASGTRANNVAAAGGTGFIVTNDNDDMGTINGNATTPAVIVGSTDGDQIRAAITGGQTVTVTGTSSDDFVQQRPAWDDQVASFSSRGYRRAGNVKPDVAAVGGSVFSAAVGTGALGRDLGGTSMAAPMVAGLAALVLAEQPTWDPEQVKANIMNTAGGNVDTNGSAAVGGDRYGPNRVGSGRIDAEAALDNEVLAYVTDDDGAVSVSFGPVEVAGPTTISKTVTVENTGSSAATYTAAYDAITSIPGVAVDVTPATVPIAAGGTASVTVTLRIDNAAALTKTVDATHGRFGSDPYEYLADASGNLLLTPSSGSAPQLRVPVYAAPRPASGMSQATSVPIGTNGTGTLTLQGFGVDQGAGVERVRSLAFGLELQATSGVAPACGGIVTTLCTDQVADSGADLRYVGVTADDSQAYFGLATHGTWSTPEGRFYVEVHLDVNRDGTTDGYLFNTRYPDTDTVIAGYQVAGSDTVYLAGGIDNRLGDVDAALFDSDVMVLPIPLSALGVDGSRQRINYGIRTFSNGDLIDQAGIGLNGKPNGSLTANLHQPALRVTGEGVPGGELDRNSTTTGPLLLDSVGRSLQVLRNAASYAADGGQGLLMLHLHNEAGDKAHVVAIAKATPAVALTASPATLVQGQATQLAVAVTDPSALATPAGEVTVRNTATGAVVASGPLSGGSASLTYQPTSAGAEQLVATYAGDATFATASSAPAALTVNAPPTPPTPPIPPAVGKSPAVLTLQLPRSATVGKKVRATVAVATVGGGPATGKVVLKNGKKTIGQATLKNGKAVVVFKVRKKGRLTLTATYAGDASYQAGTSPSVKVTIKPKGKKRKR